MGENIFRDIGILAGAIGTVIDLNNCNNKNRFCDNNWHNTVYKPVYSPPVVYSSPVYSSPVIQSSIPQGCYGNQNRNHSRQWHRDDYRHRGDYSDCPRIIPNCTGMGNYPTFPSNTGAYPTESNFAYPTVIYGGDGQQTAKIQIAGREIEFNQATNTIASRNLTTGAVKSFSGLNSPYNNSFTEIEKQQIRNGQTVERNLGDENRAKIYFVPSSDRSRIENVIVTYDNQEVLTVGNLSNLNYGRGLSVQTPNNSYNYPYNQGQSA